MTSVSGHLLNYDFPSQYSKWNACDPKTLFSAPIIQECSDTGKKIKSTIQREIRQCSVLIIWTDCDREGENIGFEIIKVCREVKPNIRILRAHFSEITVPAITRALASLSDPDKKVSGLFFIIFAIYLLTVRNIQQDAVDVRQQLDLRIGAAFTRFLTMGIQQKVPRFPEKSIVSYGSCQFPTLGFVVERYKQIEEFVPQPFWVIEVLHTKNNIKCNFTWKRQRLYDYRSCLAIHAKIFSNGTAIVTKLSNRHKSKYRPIAMDTVSFERLASSKLKINAKRAMAIAEKLYTSGYISYPRTETNKFPPEIKLNDLIGAQSESLQWGTFANRIIQRGGATPRNGTFRLPQILLFNFCIH